MAEQAGPTVVLVLLAIVIEMLPVTVQYDDGAPSSSCKDLRPIHRPHQPQQTPNPYHVRFMDDVVDYRCGETVRSKILVLSAVIVQN